MIEGPARQRCWTRRRKRTCWSSAPAGDRARGPAAGPDQSRSTASRAVSRRGRSPDMTDMTGLRRRTGPATGGPGPKPPDRDLRPCDPELVPVDGGVVENGPASCWRPTMSAQGSPYASGPPSRARRARAQGREPPAAYVRQVRILVPPLPDGRSRPRTAGGRVSAGLDGVRVVDAHRAGPGRGAAPGHRPAAVGRQGAGDGAEGTLQPAQVRWTDTGRWRADRNGPREVGNSQGRDRACLGGHGREPSPVRR